MSARDKVHYWFITKKYASLADFLIRVWNITTKVLEILIHSLNVIWTYHVLVKNGKLFRRSFGHLRAIASK